MRLIRELHATLSTFLRHQNFSFYERTSQSSFLSFGHSFISSICLTPLYSLYFPLTLELQYIFNQHLDSLAQ